MNLALVHETLAEPGGAEQVLAELRLVFPTAPVFVLEDAGEPRRDRIDVRSSFLQRVPHWIRRRRWHLPLLPIAAETLDLSAYDVVVSTSSSFAKGIVTRRGTLHICYCHTPTRFLWDAYASARRSFAPGDVRRLLFPPLAHALRLWDRVAAQRVDVFIANSETTRARIEKYYRRSAVVLRPPNRFARPRAAAAGEGPRRYFLFVGRLSTAKNARLAVETFNKLRLPLVVVGDGRERRALEAIAGSTITFRGRVSDEELAELYAGARAVVFPSDDDFGLVPVEAMSFGTPVIALRRGGATETVVEGVTGEFFDEPLEEFLGGAVRRFLDSESCYDHAALRAHVLAYSPQFFHDALRSLVLRAHSARALPSSSREPRMDTPQYGSSDVVNPLA